MMCPVVLLVQVQARQAAISKELENSGDDMERMQKLLDELDKLNSRVRHNLELACNLCTHHHETR